MIALLAASVLLLPASMSAQFGPAPSQGPSSEPFLQTNSAAENHLGRADDYLRTAQWAEGIDILQQVMQTHGDSIVELSPGRKVSVLTYCHLRLCRLPAEALAIYRQQVDPQARRWFEEAQAHRRDAGATGVAEGLLLRVVRQAFNSSYGDDALLLLGDLAWERGQVAQARAHWDNILPPDDPEEAARDDVLAYPDTDLDPAAVRARLVLAGIALARGAGATEEIEAFAQRYGDAQGTLAGRQGNLLEILREVAVASREWPLLHADHSWPTFAGNYERNKVLGRAVDVGALQWAVDLPETPATDGTLRRMSGQPMRRVAEDRLLSYHPLLVGDLVIVNTEETIQVFNIHTGEPAWPSPQNPRDATVYPSPGETLPRRPTLRPTLGVPRFTMTAEGDRLYARMGSPLTSLPANQGFGEQPGRLVCLDLAAEAKLVWSIEPDNGFAFEGAPVVGDGRLYIGLRRGGGIMPEAFVACYEAETGRQVWQRFVCQHSTPASGTGVPEITHNMLTLAGDTLFYCTNLGAVAALEASDGSIRWITTYERTLEGGGAFMDRDLNPCLYHEGLLIAAPSDTPRVMALDADTGRLVWRTELLEDAVHLLGVSQGMLFASGDQLWALRANSGKVDWVWPDNDDDTASRGFGRGVVVGGEVWWPTRTHIYVLDQLTGLPVRQPISLTALRGVTGGNLLVADGYLLVAQADQLAVFSQYSRLIERYRQEIAQNPESGPAHFRLAEAAAALEDFELALASYERATQFAQPDELVAGEELPGLALRRLHELLLQLGGDAAEAGDWETAAARFNRAAERAPNSTARLDALLRLAEMRADAAQPAAAVAVYQQILGETALTALTFEDAGGRMVGVDALMAERIAGLIDAHGREVYAPFDRQAEAALAAALESGEPDEIDAVVRLYPNALVRAPALRQLAELYASTAQLSEASRTYKRLLASLGPEDPEAAGERVAALYGLARVYEEQGFWIAARRRWDQLASEYPDHPLPRAGEAPESPTTVAAFVAERLSSDLFRDQVLFDGPPAVPVPLERRWEESLTGEPTTLLPEGVPPSLDSRCVLVWTAHEGLSCYAHEDGAFRWRTTFETPPIWAGYTADGLLVAATDRIASLALLGGQMVWERRFGDTNGSGTGVPPVGLSPGSRAAGPLEDFVLVGSQLFVRQGDARVLAMDAEEGHELWSFSPTQGSLNPHLYADGERVIVQTRSPSYLVALNAEDGQMLFRLDAPSLAWPREPALLGGTRLVIVRNRRDVEMIDLERGARLWQYEGPAAPANGAPDVLTDGEHLVLVANGWQVSRLDPASGEELWSAGLGTGALRDPRLQAAVDDAAVYSVSAGVLRAYGLNDGQVLWERYVGLPSSAWRVERTDRLVAAYPLRSEPQRLLATEAERFPLVFCVPETGELVQQLWFRGRPEEATVALEPGSIVVSLADQVWGLGAWGGAEP